jgi:hypothetical protein
MMPWTAQDDLNWSIYETGSIRRLDDAGATIEGRDMFRDLLRGGRARVRARGFSSNDLQRGRQATDNFIDGAKRAGNGGDIDIQHLQSAISGFCPFFPL